MDYEIIFTNPVNYAGENATSNEPFAFKNATIVSTSTQNTSSTTGEIAIFYGFTVGEAIISFFLFLLLLVMLWNSIVDNIMGIKIRRKLI